MASLYIHIPFCLKKCDYCSFNSFAGLDTLFPRYIKALKKEIVDLVFAGRIGTLDTIFFGGGTPSILSADQIEEILTCCREYPGVAEDAEISLEANPKTLDFMKLLQIRQAGVNRISIGIQSFIDTELDRLGRLHTAQDSWNCVRDVIGAGFTNFSLDLMYGIPAQTAEQWRWNMENALSLDTPHLSLYQLTVEEDTPLAESIARGDLVLPDEEEILLMDEITSEMTNRKGMGQYEISNFAIPGYECSHNLNYWHNLDYAAAGAGAVAFYQGERLMNVSDPLQYCAMVEGGGGIVAESEKLGLEESFRESVVLGLRMAKGVSCEALLGRYSINLKEYYGDTLSPLLSNGLVEFTETHFRLTQKGRYLANQVLAELV